MKNIFIILTVILLIGCSNNNIIHNRNVDNWDNPISTPHFGVNKNIAVPFIQNLEQPPFKKYCFVTTPHPQKSWGDIYYGDEFNEPIYKFTDGMSPVICGDWIFAIYINSYDAYEFPISTSIIRYNIKTDNIEILEQPKTDPCWNYIMPSMNGNMYICASINFSLIGDIKIVHNGNTIFSENGSYLFPTLSSDGTTAGWCYDDTPNSYGNRHAQLYNIDLDTIQTIHTTNNETECQYINLSADGNTAVYTVVIAEWNGHGYTCQDQELWQYKNKNNNKINILDYRWVESPQLSNDGNLIIFSANKDVFEYRGYNILCNNGIETFEVIDYNVNKQYLWCDITNDGWIIWCKEIIDWSNYTLHCTNINGEDYGEIINLNNIIRDAKFIN